MSGDIATFLKDVFLLLLILAVVTVLLQIILTRRRSGTDIQKWFDKIKIPQFMLSFLTPFTKVKEGTGKYESRFSRKRKLSRKF